MFFLNPEVLAFWRFSLNSDDKKGEFLRNRRQEFSIAIFKKATSSDLQKETWANYEEVMYELLKTET